VLVDTDHEIRRLRTVLRDLIALSVIPAAWVGREPPAVATGLADTLIGLLQLDFAFVRLRDPSGAGAVDVTRGSTWKAFPEWLEHRLATSILSRKEIVHDVGAGSERYVGVVIPVGVDAEGGVVAAASERPDFPTETDQLMLSLAANHAATAFQSARLIHERKRAEEELRGARDELEVKVAERTVELRRSREELAASRARIVSAADESRRRIERDLHDGVQQQLVSLGFELHAMEDAEPDDELKVKLAKTASGLASALEDLVEISRGIHPAILAEGGLPAALTTLARRSAVPAELDVRVDTRLPEAVEVAAYYVVSEALTNTAKYARASAVQIAVFAREGVLQLSIRDDGRGGADATRGSGLIGLSDRVDALGGSIELTSPVGEGTTLLVTLPIEDP
jgi:signal transduction histidine kinase